MPVEIYRIIHIFGILLVFTGLAGLWGVMYTGPKGKKVPGRAALSALHGVGLLIVLISGMGMAGKLGYMANFPSWLIGKLVIWLLLGGAIVLAKRKANLGASLLVAFCVLGGVAAYLAIAKP